MRNLWVFLALSVALAACTKTEKEIVYQYPPKDVLESFSTTTCAKKNCIKISKGSLNKTFLLMISGKTVGAIPQWADFKPAIVTFEQTGAQVGLFAVAPEAIYGQEDAKNLLQSFDVISEDENFVTFDWGQGLSSLRTQGVFDTEVDLGEDVGTSSSLEIVNAYIKNVSVSRELIEITQISKVRETKLTNRKENPFDSKDQGKPAIDTSEQTFNFSIQFYPYGKNPNFTPKLADKSRTVGFFVSKVAVPEVGGEKQNLITKWDFTTPVHFLMSANTPVEYQDAIREGLLYWNKVLGFEAVKVELGVDDRSAPPIHSVMVRWIPWEDAGYAYAQAQNDPLTGEMLRGQLFLTPAFAHTKGYTKKLAPVINPLVACDLGKTFQKGDVYPQTPEDKRIALDDLRSVAAHEAGHALGLRHNFAASASVAATQKDVLKAIGDYLKDANHPGLMTATTVMDYLKATEDILVGRFIQNNPLPYDQMAMKWAYSKGSEGLDPAVSKYCSDEDLMKASAAESTEIYDCRQMDPTGSSLLAFINAHVRDRQNLLSTKYKSILEKVFPEDEEITILPLETVLKDNHVSLGLDLLTKQIGYHKNAAGLVSLENWKNVLGRTLNPSPDSSLQSLLKADLDEVGSFANAKALLTPVSSSWTASDLQIVLDEIAKGQGTVKGRSYQLTADQQARLTQYFKDEAASAETELQKQLNDLFVGL